MYNYVLFDLDGTLTHPKIGITTCVQYALKAFGIDEPDLDKLEPFIGPPLKESFMEFYGFDKEKAMEAVKFYREYYEVKGIYECKLYDGILFVAVSLHGGFVRAALFEVVIINRCKDITANSGRYISIRRSASRGTSGHRREVGWRK